MVGLLEDEDRAMSSIVRWMNDCVVDAVEAPRVADPARPDLTVKSIQHTLYAPFLVLIFCRRSHVPG